MTRTRKQPGPAKAGLAPFAGQLRPLVQSIGTGESARICGVTPRSLQLWMSGARAPCAAMQAGVLGLLKGAASPPPGSTMISDSWPDWRDGGRAVEVELDDGRTVRGVLFIQEFYPGTDGDEVPLFGVRAADGESYSFADVRRWRFAT